MYDGSGMEHFINQSMCYYWKPSMRTDYLMMYPVDPYQICGPEKLIVFTCVKMDGDTSSWKMVLLKCGMYSIYAASHIYLFI